MYYPAYMSKLDTTKPTVLCNILWGNPCEVFQEQGDKNTHFWEHTYFFLWHGGWVKPLLEKSVLYHRWDIFPSYCKQLVLNRNLFSTSYQQIISRCYLGHRALACVEVCLEEIYLNNENPHIFLLDFSDEHEVTWHKIWLWPVWVSCLTYVPFPTSFTPSLPAFGQNEGWRDSLDAVWVMLSISWNTGTSPPAF